MVHFPKVTPSQIFVLDSMYGILHVLSMQKKPSLNKHRLTRYIPYSSPELKNPKLVAETLLECIRTGDVDAFRDVLMSHLMSTNKVHLARKAGIGRRTLYDLIDLKKKFNPGLSTISAVIRALISSESTKAKS